MQSSSASHRKSDTFDTFDEIWENENEEIRESCFNLDETASNYFLTFNLDPEVEESQTRTIRCSTLDFNEVLALERFHIHHKYHFSPKHLPVTPSNLLKSETDQNDWNDEDKDNFDHKYETEDEGSSKRSQSTDEGMLSTIENEQPPNYSQVPIAGALFVATCLGTPVIALTGLKMGMFAAVGGGVMGFATGKMFAEHEEKQALAKGKFPDDDSGVSAKTKKKKTLRRIHEWQRFEANCQLVKDFDEEQITKISEMQKEISKHSTPVKPKKQKSKES